MESKDKTPRQNRVREALGKLYDQEPPYFRECLRRFQEDPTSRVFAPLAEAYRRLGRVDEAIEICREGLGHHPDFHGGRVALARCLLDKKWFEEAKTELERVVAASPENLLAQRLLGDAWLALKEREGALHCYKMALLLSPNDVQLAEKVHQLEKDTARERNGSTLADEVSSAEMESPIETSPEDALEAALDEVQVDSGHTFDADRPDEAGQDDFWSPEAEPLPDEARVEKAETSEEPLAEVPLAATDSKADIDTLLGAESLDADDESFKIEHVSAIFQEENAERTKEITTATLGDLYFAQGQFDRAIRIFEKLHAQRPNPELARKINACRVKLGVDREALVRNRQIEMLRTILRTVRGERREPR